jgi:hypothetical protein
MSALALPASSFWLPFQGLETANAASIDGELKPIRAAERLRLTTRQVRRLARRYAAAVPAGLISKRFSRPSNNRLHDAMTDQVITLLRSTYAAFGPTLAAEKLRTKHGIDLAKQTADRCWPMNPAEALAAEDSSTQIEAGVHRLARSDRWLRTSLVRRRGPACTALVFIDDATSRLMQIYFNCTESTFGYFETTRRRLSAHENDTCQRCLRPNSSEPLAHWRDIIVARRRGKAVRSPALFVRSDNIIGGDF